jgi:hypothetical protein
MLKKRNFLSSTGFTPDTPKLVLRQEAKALDPDSELSFGGSGAGAQPIDDLGLKLGIMPF